MRIARGGAAQPPAEQDRCGPAASRTATDAVRTQDRPQPRPDGRRTGRESPVRTANRRDRRRSRKSTAKDRRCGRLLRLGSRGGTLRLRIAALLVSPALLAVGGTLPLRSVTRSGAVRSGIVAAATQQIHRVGQNLGRITLVVVLVHPLAGAQTALDIELRALAHIAIHDIREAAPQRDRVPLGMLLRLVRRTVVQPLGRSQPDTGDLRAALERADFGVDAHVAHQNHLVYHNIIPDFRSFAKRASASSRPPSGPGAARPRGRPPRPTGRSS